VSNSNVVQDSEWVSDSFAVAVAVTVVDVEAPSDEDVAREDLGRAGTAVIVSTNAGRVDTAEMGADDDEDDVTCAVAVASSLFSCGSSRVALSFSLTSFFVFFFDNGVAMLVDRDDDDDATADENDVVAPVASSSVVVVHHDVAGNTLRPLRLTVYVTEVEEEDVVEASVVEEDVVGVDTISRTFFQDGCCFCFCFFGVDDEGDGFD